MLFFFVSGEDSDLADLGVQKAVQDGIPERAGAAGDEEIFVLEHEFCHLILTMRYSPDVG
jgi:hypothetical protein